MTEKEANYYIEKLYKDLNEILKTESGFRYIAIVKNKKNLNFEFSYKTGNKNDKDSMTKKRAEELVSLIRIKLFDEAVISLMPWFTIKKNIRKYVFNIDVEKINIELNKEKEIFQSYCSKKPNNTIVNGKILGDKQGTLGGMISLNGSNDNYIMSNHHVLMGNRQLESEITYNNIAIAELFWGLFNEKYDVALAKINKTINIKLANKNYMYNKVVNIHKRFYKLKNLRTFNSDGPQNKGEIYSKNAIVKVKYGNEYKLYKNQILTKNMFLVPGNSGSIIVEDSGKTKKNIIGLFIGGDSTFGVLNNLYNLFNETNEDNKIEFKSFIN